MRKIKNIGESIEGKFEFKGNSESLDGLMRSSGREKNYSIDYDPALDPVKYLVSEGEIIGYYRYETEEKESEGQEKLPEMLRKKEKKNYAEIHIVKRLNEITGETPGELMAYFESKIRSNNEEYGRFAEDISTSDKPWERPRISLASDAGGIHRGRGHRGGHPSNYPTTPGGRRH